MKMVNIGREEVLKKFGVYPEKVIDVQALAGDSTDNIPGVPGIGIKTAAELINEYGYLAPFITVDKLKNFHLDKNIEIVDVGCGTGLVGVELHKLGAIENSFHIPRGLLEFSINPESAYVQNNKLDLNKEIVLQLICFVDPG